MKIKIIPSLLSIAVLSAITTNAFAAGTAAGVEIDNTANISYKVGNVTQTPIYSSPNGNTLPGVPGTAGAPTVADTKTTFTVDKKIDLLVTKGSDVTVVPEATNKNLTFTLKNEGNSTEYFKLESADVATDNFDPTNCSITAPASPVQLNADQQTVITVKCDIPVASTNVADGKTATVDMKATAVTDATGNTVYADTVGTDTAINAPGSEDIVLADDIGSATDIAVGNSGNRNATHSAVNNYNVVTANLKVKKESSVYSDPFNGLASGGNNPKRIPGAEIEYTITIQNTGTADATNLVMSDPLPTNMTFVAGSCAITGAASAPTCNLAGSNVDSSAFVLAGGETATLTFRAKVD